MYFQHISTFYVRKGQLLSLSVLAIKLFLSLKELIFESGFKMQLFQ